jgi:Mysoin-binding motif of peroxisomes
MYQVYNIDDTLSTDLPEIPSLADLKATCIAMHERRRQVLCAILAIHVEPYDPAWSTWRTVIRELDGLTRILADFTRELTRSLQDEECISF